MQNSPGLGPGRVRSSAFDLKKQKEQQQKQPKQQELLQLLLQVVVVVVLAVVIVVLLLKSAHARAAVREPPGRVIASCFHLVATFFSMIFMTLFFSQNNATSSKKVPKILPKSVRNLTLARFSLIFCTPCF